MTDPALIIDEIVPIAGTPIDFVEAMGASRDVELSRGIWCLDPETGRWWWEPLTAAEAAKFDEAVANSTTIRTRLVWELPGASIHTLRRRASYGGRKGRRALVRLDALELKPDRWLRRPPKRRRAKCPHFVPRLVPDNACPRGDG